MKRRDTVYARQGGTKVHVAKPGLVDSNGHGIEARCGAVLHGDEYLARMVPPADRCQAPACRKAWPAHLRSVG